jgi:hypothetical protein
MSAQPDRITRGKRIPIVDMNSPNRAWFERWLLRHGLKSDDLHRVERLVVRPDLDHAIAVFPWSEDAGQLYVKLRLERSEIVTIDRDAPLQEGPAGNLFQHPDTKWRDALEVWCPACRARPGDWCVARGGWPVARRDLPHYRRMGW